ncbi:MAG TPA: hypothetical protein H9881_05635 [Candidatus Stackebrandtia excrementipullorum]|nr:hypothetical protein [Candidatus Stackebrandtia excrementipullorum]
MKRVLSPRLRWAGVAVAALVAASAATFVWWPGGDADTPIATETVEPSAPDAPEHCLQSPVDTGVTEPVPAPDNGDVEVTDKGWTLSLKHPPVGALSFGTVLTNTTDLVATGLTVTVSAQRPDGQAVAEDGSSEAWEWSQPLGYIGPGDDFGFGMRAPIALEDLEQDLNLIVDVEVTEWWPMENDVHTFASLTAHVPEVEDMIDPDRNLEFSVHSDYCTPVPAGHTVIFRDGDGNIIAGTADVADNPSTAETPYVAEYTPGANESLLTENSWMLHTSQEHTTSTRYADVDIYPYAPTEEELAT